jgi:hypothetical protein
MKFIVHHMIHALPFVMCSSSSQVKYNQPLIEIAIRQIALLLEILGQIKAPTDKGEEVV